MSYREAGHPAGVALATTQRMDTWFFLGEYDRAAADGEAALGLYERGGTAARAAAEPVAVTLAKLAQIEARRGRPEATAGYTARAQQLLDEGNIPVPTRAHIDHELAVAAIETGRPADAVPRLERALAIQRQVGDHDYEWRDLFGLGRAVLALGQPEEAQKHLEAAISIVERLCETLPEAGLRAAFMSDRVRPYDSLVEAMMAQSRTSDDGFARRALEVAERSKGRALAELLAESRARPADSRLQAIRAQELEFSKRFSSLQKQVIAATNPDERQTLLRDLEEAEREYERRGARLPRAIWM